MSGFNRNLPLDIPWRRIAVTEDMIDAKAGDRTSFKTPIRTLLRELWTMRSTSWKFPDR
jgi:hypothetical protein